MVSRASKLITAEQKTDLSVVLRRTLLIASDFDGSIVPDHMQNYHEDTRVIEAAELIRELTSKGYKFATVTGSRVSRAKLWADMSGSQLFAENAGVRYDPKHPSKAPRILVDREESDFIIKNVVPKIDAFLDKTFTGYTKSEGKYTMATYHKPESVTIEDFRNSIFGFIATLPMETRQRLFTTYSHTLVDVNHKGADKSRGIRFMHELFGIDVDRFTAYGDGDNDRPAFESVLTRNGTVIIPSNHDREVEAWLSGKQHDERIATHNLESTNCLVDILSELRRKQADD
ncbi:HAD-IIB family hydrolase [Candidatus Marsarchaeota archaeon]|nr:HAD-IIB family hydrolase [Candidatus Marsarchaeota archaeon]